MLLRDKVRLNYNTFFLYFFTDIKTNLYTKNDILPMYHSKSLTILFWKEKTIASIRMEVEAMICLHKLIYMSRLTKELCRFTSYSTSLYCRCQVERHTQRGHCYWLNVIQNIMTIIILFHMHSFGQLFNEIT